MSLSIILFVRVVSFYLFVHQHFTAAPSSQGFTTGAFFLLSGQVITAAEFLEHLKVPFYAKPAVPVGA